MLTLVRLRSWLVTGVFTFVGGIKYEGAWNDDKFHGAGVLTQADGSKYDGMGVGSLNIEPSVRVALIVWCGGRRRCRRIQRRQAMWQGCVHFPRRAQV